MGEFFVGSNRDGGGGGSAVIGIYGDFVGTRLNGTLEPGRALGHTIDKNCAGGSSSFDSTGADARAIGLLDPVASHYSTEVGNLFRELLGNYQGFTRNLLGVY